MRLLLKKESGNNIMAGHRILKDIADTYQKCENDKTVSIASKVLLA